MVAVNCLASYWLQCVCLQIAHGHCLAHLYILQMTHTQVSSTLPHQEQQQLIQSLHGKLHEVHAAAVAHV